MMFYGSLKNVCWSVTSSAHQVLSLRGMLHVVLVLSVVGILPACAGSPGNGGGNRGNSPPSEKSPYSTSEEVEEKHRRVVRERFEMMKDALENGDLKTLKKLWIHPSGRTYTIPEISNMYSRKGKQFAARVREARIRPPGIIISSPSRAIRRRHPDAQYTANLAVRNSFGDPVHLVAIYTNGSWRFLQQINVDFSGDERRK